MNTRTGQHDDTASDAPFYDAAIIGLGIIGAAALECAARAGLSVLGIEQYHSPHDQGSSHGQTRLLRTAYVEGDIYIPLMMRALALWQEAETRLDADLFRQTGIYYAAPPRGTLVRDVVRAAQKYGLPVTRPWTNPHIKIPGGWDSVLENGAGYLRAETSVSAFLTGAQRAGATIAETSAVSALEPSGKIFKVVCDEKTFSARKIIVAAGGWSATLLPALGRCLRVERRVLNWFEDPGGQHTEETGFKPFAIENERGHWVYGFPSSPGYGVKMADHHDAQGSHRHPRDIDRTIYETDWRAVQNFKERFLQRLGPRLDSRICFYTMTPDEDFLLGPMPGMAGVFVATGMSGHGFKFAPVIGEVLTDLLLEHTPAFDIEPLSVSRFAG